MAGAPGELTAPKTPGVVTARTEWSRRDRAPRRPFPQPWPESAAAVADAWEFFTPAVLHLQGKITEAAWVDMLHAAPGMGLYFAKFDQALFSGLESRDGSPDWNFVLFAVQKIFFPHLVRFLSGCVIREKTTGEVRCFFPQEVHVLDPFSLHKSRMITNATPALAVTAFGVTTRQWRYGLAQSRDLLVRRPWAARSPARGTALQYAQTLASGGNPVMESVKDIWRYFLTSKGLRLRSSQTIDSAPDF